MAISHNRCSLRNMETYICAISKESHGRKTLLKGSNQVELSGVAVAYDWPCSHVNNDSTNHHQGIHQLIQVPMKCLEIAHMQRRYQINKEQL